MTKVFKFLQKKAHHLLLCILSAAALGSAASVKAADAGGELMEAFKGWMGTLGDGGIAALDTFKKLTEHELAKQAMGVAVMAGTALKDPAVKLFTQFTEAAGAGVKAAGNGVELLAQTAKEFAERPDLETVPGIIAAIAKNDTKIAELDALYAQKTLHHERDKIRAEKVNLEKHGLFLTGRKTDMEAEETKDKDNLRQIKVAKVTAAGKIGAVKTAVQTLVSPQVGPYIVGALSFLVVLNYLSKEYFSFASKKLQEPTIEQERSHTQTEKFINFILQRPPSKSSNLHDVILSPELQEEIDVYGKGIKNCIANGANLPHILFCGPPGTGKTALAKRLARYLKFKYKTFSPSDLEQDEEEALRTFKEMLTNITEPTLFLIDECENLFRKRGEQTSDITKKLLSLFLAITSETDNKNYMIIGITNRIGDIDDAVINRFNTAITIPLPAQAERVRILEKYVNAILLVRKKARQKLSFFAQLMGKRPIREKALVLPEKAFDAAALEKIAAALDGLAGREIEKMVDNMKTYALGKKDRSLSYAEIDSFIRKQLLKAKVILPDDFKVYPEEYYAPAVPDGTTELGEAAATAA